MPHRRPSPPIRRVPTARSPTIAALAAALACATPVGSARAADPERLEPVQVVANGDDPIGTTDAASRGSVDAARILAVPILRPADVLERVPGLVVTQHSGDGKANQYFLRGFNLDHGTDFATTVAGVPVNLPTHAHGHGYTDLNFLVPELIERIDWRKGPYSALDGDFSSAGAADIRLRSRFAAPVGQLTIGSNGYRRAFAGASPSLGAGTLLLAAEALANDGPWDVPQDARRANAVVRWSGGTAANGQELTLMGYDARWTATDQVPQRALDAGAIGRFGSLDPSTGGTSSRFSLSGSMRRALDDGRLDVSAWALRYRLNLFSNFTYLLDRPDTGDQFEQADSRVAYGLRAARAWNGTTLGLPSQTTLGVQARQDRIDVGLFDTRARERTATVRDDRVTSTLAGAFGEHAVFWTDRFRTIAGLRLDRLDNRVDASLPENAGRGRDTLASPKLAAVLTATPALETFASVGRGFHSNDARGTTARVDPRTGDALVPVQGLVPTLGGEIGARWTPTPTLLASLALWQLDIDSELVFVGDAGVTEPSRGSRRRGVEAGVRWLPRPWLAIDGDLSLSRARFVDDDPAGPFVPGSAPRVASLGVAVQRLGPWSGGLRVRHVGPRPLVEDGSVRSRPFTLADLRVGYRLAPRLDLLLDVFNLADRRANDIEYFYASRLAGEPAEGVADRHLHPAEPRTMRLSLRVGF
ncbi:MAG TPA: TonB-dependent receptor [Burkholderiaceae bacterium]|nr:TonB-dependent receptor [Burkholderiaceae bacterium]